MQLKVTKLKLFITGGRGSNQGISLFGNGEKDLGQSPIQSAQSLTASC